MGRDGGGAADAAAAWHDQQAKPSKWKQWFEPEGSGGSKWKGWFTLNPKKE